MSIHVVENLGTTVYAFTDPDCFLSCDSPLCASAWVTGTSLVTWAIEENTPSGSRFTDRLVVACSAGCLRSALRDRGRGHRWSEPMPVGDWLDALRASVELDPETVTIGEFAGAT